jgi:hypothetical protein
MANDRRLSRVRQVKSAHEADLMRKPFVVGVGIGRRREGRVLGEPVIVVSVSAGPVRGRSAARDVIPHELDGVPVEIRVVDSLKALVARAAQVRAAHTADLLTRRHVVGVGVGYKRSGGVETGELSVVVSVVRKLPQSALAASDLIPRALDGFRTDVVETGSLVAFGTGPRDRWRPVVPPGVSVGHFRVTAATFGCLVRRGHRLFILSNNHVLADTNSGVAGDAVLQPGPADGGVANDQVATLSDFVPLDFGTEPSTCSVAEWAVRAANLLATALGSSHRVRAVRQTPGINHVDAALAEPMSPELVRSEILYIGSPVGQGEAALGMPVQKTGRTSGYTHSAVAQIDATVRIDYGGREALFAGQFIAGQMSRPGDSGSAVLDMDRRVVGLLFAGSDLATVCNPIDQVLSALDVELVL